MERFICETEDSVLLRDVYEHLQDEESRQIYTARSLFSLSDDKSYLKSVVRKMVISKCMMEELEKHSDQDFVLFGAGTWGKAITYFFPQIKWKCIVDNNKDGEKLNNYDIVSFDKLRKMEKVYVVIAVLFKYQEIEDQLLESGFSADDILALGRIAEEKQYFDLPGLQFAKDEVFVDAGGFNGDTSCRFAQITNNQYKHIYLFEPNTILQRECQRNMSGLSNYTLIQKGAWDSTGTLRFYEDGEGSRIADDFDNLTEIETVSLDEYLGKENVSFIKMDIEGAEMTALKGAENIIRSSKPKLAISVYHRRTDIWEVPRLLLKYNPDYKLYLRIYSFTGNDTVLYAI